MNKIQSGSHLNDQQNTTTTTTTTTHSRSLSSCPHDGVINPAFDEIDTHITTSDAPIKSEEKSSDGKSLPDVPPLVTQLMVPPLSSVASSPVAIIGCGDFGRAMATRLVRFGFTVLMGTRDPLDKKDMALKLGVKMVPIKEAICECSIIILAIRIDFYNSLPLKDLSGKILVDVSNRKSSKKKSTLISQSEHLQYLVPEANVVKAFNVLSAYSLEAGRSSYESEEIPIAGDFQESKEHIIRLCRNVGFVPIDRGALKSSREIEDIPMERFPKWRLPIMISFLLFMFLYLLTFLKIQICWTVSWGSGEWHWEFWHYIPMDNVNKTVAVHSVILLSCCYLPGLFAAYLQLYRGTRYSEFPQWLDRWLRIRKQIGLLMLFSASIHACLSLATLSPIYNSTVFERKKVILTDLVTNNFTHLNINANQTVNILSTEKMNWRGECFLISGVMSFGLAVILGLTSLPSIGQNLTWKEFSIVQSKLGWLCMLLACSHDIFIGWPYINSPSCSIPSSFQYALYAPGVAILLKIPLLIPCVSSRLTKIRHGQEQKSFGSASPFMSSIKSSKKSVKMV